MASKILMMTRHCFSRLRSVIQIILQSFINKRLCIFNFNGFHEFFTWKQQIPFKIYISNIKLIALFNANRPEDLVRAEALLASATRPAAAR